MLVNDDEVKLTALILPGHVSTIIGLEPYRFLAERYGIEVVSEQYAQETLDLIRQFPDLVAEDAPGMGQAQG